MHDLDVHSSQKIKKWQQWAMWANWPKITLPIATRGVSPYGLTLYTKNYLKAKENLWKFKYFTMQNYNLQKTPLKETKILQDIITL
jgi:hypothetical protein